MSEISHTRPEIRPTDYTEQLLVMRDVAGFMPLSADELDEAFELLDPSQTGLRIDNIVRHQRNVHARYPKKAAEAVAHEYIKYARSSASIEASLRGLQDELPEVSNPAGHALDITHRRNALLAIIQFADLNAFAEGNAKVGSPLGRQYTTHKEDEFVATRLRGLKTRDMRRLLPAALENQVVRRDFWRTRVESLLSHDIASPIIKRAITLKAL